MARTARMGPEFQRYSVYDFGKGLDLRTNPRKRAAGRGQNTLSKAVECLYTSSGSVARRRRHRALTGTSNELITGGMQFVRSNGRSTNVFGTTAGNLYEVADSISAIDNVSTLIGSGFTNNTRWYFAQFNDRLLCCNRADALRAWDGTTLSTLAGTYLPLTPGPIAVHRNRVYVLDATNKSRVSYCVLTSAATPNGETDWTTTGAATGAGQTLIDPNDGGECVGLISGVNELIVLKTSRPYRWQGVDATAVTVLPTSSAVGGVSHQGALFALNDVWYLARSGIAKLETSQQFGDLRSSFPSDPIRPFFESGTEYALAVQHLGNATMAYDASLNLLYIAVDRNADGFTDLILVYDMALGAWSTIYSAVAVAGSPGAFRMSAMWPVRDPESGRVNMWVALVSTNDINSTLAILNRRDSTSAVLMSPEARHLTVLNAPGIEKSPRHGFFYFAEQGNYTVTVDCKIDGEQVASKSYSVSMLGASHVLGSTWVLGTDPLGARSSIAKRVDLSGVGEQFEFGVRNAHASQHWEWQGYDIYWRPRRQIRRGA